MAERLGKYLCPCLPFWDLSSQRRSGRSKVRALARKRHKNNQGPTSTSGVEDSVTITRNGSLTIFSVSGGTGEGLDRNASCPDARRERIDLPGVVPSSAADDERLPLSAATEPKPNLADGTRTLTNEALLRLPQPTKAYVSNVKMRRLMKEFQVVSKIAAEGLADKGKTDEKVSEQEVKPSENVGKDSNNVKEAEVAASCSISNDESKGGTSVETKDSGEGGDKKAEASGGASSMASLKGPPYDVELVNDSLTEWNVKLYHIHPTSSLSKDMKKHNIDHVLFNITFPDDFPFAPPFVRVVTPHIEYGYVLDGGAICMELLTPQGWSSAYTIDAVILQLGATLVAGDGRIVQAGVRSDVPFNKPEAQESFRAIVETHERYGWHKVPGDNS